MSVLNEEKQLKLAYWFASHKLQFKQYFLVLLVMVNVILWILVILYLVFFFVNLGKHKLVLELLPQNTVEYAQYHETTEPNEIQTIQSYAIKGVDDGVDMVFELKNPNKDWYASFTYRIIGTNFTSEQFTSFLLPDEQQFIMHLALKDAQQVSSVSLNFDDIQWKRVKDYEEYALNRYRFEVSDPIEFIPSTTTSAGIVPVSKAMFSVVNRSAFSFWEVPLTIVAYRGSQIVSVNMVTLDQLMSGEERDVTVTWFESMTGVNRIYVQPHIDILDEGVYIQSRFVE